MRSFENGLVPTRLRPREEGNFMRTLQVLLLTVALAGIALAADVPVAAPEVGLDGPTIVGAIGVLSGGLLVMVARRKKK